MIKFGDLQSDLPTYQNTGALKVDNVIPLKEGYKSFPGFVELSDTALTSTPVGLFTSIGATGITNYAGDETKLYQMDNNGDFQDVSKVGGYNNSTTEGSRDFWSFTKFGDNVIGTNFADNIQKFLEGTDTAFSDLTSLKAKYLTVVRDFVVAGYTEESSVEYPQRVKWSALNDSSDWTPSQTTQSGYQDIPGEHGRLMGIVGSESFGIIFFEKAIFRMEYLGTPLIFTFNKIGNVGCFAPRSISTFGNTIYFLSQDGFYALEGGQDLVPIGSGKINNTFFNDFVAKPESVFSAIDPNNSIVVWSYRGSNSTGSAGVNNKLLIYNYSVGRWATGSGLDLYFINTASQEAFNTLESLDVLGNLDGLPRSLDSFFYDEGVVGLAGFSSNKKFGKFLGSSLSATVDTTEFEGIENKRSTLINARPIVDANGENTTVTVTPIYRSSQMNAVTEGSAVSVKDSGDCPLRATSRYHRLRINVSGNFSTLSGVDVEARVEGKR